METNYALNDYANKNGLLKQAREIKPRKSSISAVWDATPDYYENVSSILHPPFPVAIILRTQIYLPDFGYIRPIYLWDSVILHFF